MERRTWFTSDLHLGDAGIMRRRYCGTLEEMHHQLATRWDRRVALDDTVWVLGDVMCGMRDEEARDWLAARPGRKYLILGNWDTDYGPGLWCDPFLDITERKLLELDGVPLMLSHYPAQHVPLVLPAESHRTLVHGHTHSPRKVGWHEERFQVHVGWEAWRRPASWDEIKELIETAPAVAS